MCAEFSVNVKKILKEKVSIFQMECAVFTVFASNMYIFHKILKI